jgi:hypothetical protein
MEDVLGSIPDILAGATRMPLKLPNASKPSAGQIENASTVEVLELTQKFST